MKAIIQEWSHEIKHAVSRSGKMEWSSGWLIDGDDSSKGERLSEWIHELLNARGLDSGKLNRLLENGIYAILFDISRNHMIKKRTMHVVDKMIKTIEEIY